jgi:LysR family hydrogen peroxide-inducible transcriptional activator
VGITLLPTLAIKPPVARTDNVHLIEFAGQAPSRRIALVWRKSSSMGAFLKRFADVIRDIPRELLDPGLSESKASSRPRPSA